jgi:hypothetical protein
MIYDGFPNDFAILQHVQYATLQERLDKVKVCFIKTSIVISMEVMGPVVLVLRLNSPWSYYQLCYRPFLLLAVWLPWIVVCASADVAPNFIDASTPSTNIPIATIVTPNLKLFCKWCYMMQSIYLKITTRLISGQH